VGDNLTISNVTPSAYNGSNKTVTAVAGQTISYIQASNPGTFVSALAASVTDATQDKFLTNLITPTEWDALFKWETLYKVLHYLDQQDKAMMLVQPQPLPRQATPKKVQMVEVGMIPRLRNDVLTTVSQQENTDEDFSINPVIRAYSYRR